MNYHKTITELTYAHVVVQIYIFLQKKLKFK